LDSFAEITNRVGHRANQAFEEEAGSEVARLLLGSGASRFLTGPSALFGMT
jgi:hypothetical protein